MKFGKHLHGVMNMSHPDWAPYWPNYKLLKKQIKKLPSIQSCSRRDMGSHLARYSNSGIMIIPQDPCCPHQRPHDGREEAPGAMIPSAQDTTPRNIPSSIALRQRQRRAKEKAAARRTNAAAFSCRRSCNNALGERTLVEEPRATALKRTFPERSNSTRRRVQDNSNVTRAAAVRKKNLLLLRRTTGEVAFFKLLHGEVRKAHRFFYCMERQLLALCNAGILESAQNIMMWSSTNQQQPLDHSHALAMMMLTRRRICHLYRQLVLLESYAIMSYVAFSKILKKHDKATGHATRHAFMRNIVQKASFANYPRLVDGMDLCRKLFYRVSDRLDNNTSTTNHRNRDCTSTNTLDDNDGWPLSLLRDDQRLFVSVVQKLKHGSDRSSREDDDD